MIQILGIGCLAFGDRAAADDRLIFEAAKDKDAGHDKHVVLIAGDEEYRSEESMPMLAKILSQRHGFNCTVLFSFGPDGADYIDPNNQHGLRGLDALGAADLMIIGTRFRQPSAEQAKHITNYLNAGKPVIGIRTATHAFRGDGKFGGSIEYGQFGRKILGEEWVSHHGRHKVEGARGVAESAQAEHSILNGVKDVFAPTDVYGVTHLDENDTILLRAAVTESLDPSSPAVSGPKNNPMQPFAWLHSYTAPDGQQRGQSFCTTAGASVDFVNEDLRRLIVNAAHFLTGLDVPEHADVTVVDSFHPSFYGFIQDKSYWKNANLRPADFGLGKSPKLPDPPGSPAWPFRHATNQAAGGEPIVLEGGEPYPLEEGQRIALVGGSLAERMNLFGHFETRLHRRFPDKKLVVRNFGWPADEVGRQQRPGNYTKIDDPLVVFSPDLFICFFGFNESYTGADDEAIAAFVERYRGYIRDKVQRFTKSGRPPRFVLVSPIAFENTGRRLQPTGEAENSRLRAYAQAIAKLAADDGHALVDLFDATARQFADQEGPQYTINGVHVNEAGDRLIAQLLDARLFEVDGSSASKPSSVSDDLVFERIRAAVNDKSWLHLQDYRMLNGWYVYGGRRTWDTETFPGEYRKIRDMVTVRDQYIWDLAAGRPVPSEPDDSATGEAFIPETMFGSRDDNFRRGREPKTLDYPTPEDSISQMTVPDGFEVQLFASEREFPALANPTQLNFDNRGRLWVSCMANYPQWLPGAAKPNDRLLIFEDTDSDGRADECKVFYDGLICPTGFEFFDGGVLVIDQPRILFLKDTDGDDRADQIVQLIDGIGVDDTHHTMGAWEFSHGGLLYMLEGIAISTTLETPWGPFRNHGPSGAYVFDPITLKMRHFRTPGYGNPWCLVFDHWGQGIIGDGTGAQQHWASPLSGRAVDSRRTLRPIFDNQGMRPAIGSDFLLTRQFPDEVQGQFIYACVINMHGLPRFTVEDQPSGAGMVGRRIDDLLASTDMFFRPVDPKIGPDGALWFGDWCNALIGHMQYSQRDPNRDHKHGRLYRLVYKDRELLAPVTQHGKSIAELLDQLTEYEPRTRYRARRELRSRPMAEVIAAVDTWIDGADDPARLCEALWIQESFRGVDPQLLDRLLASDDFHARAAAVHTIGNEHERLSDPLALLERAIADPHPRVRLEAVRGLSFLPSARATEIALRAADQELDYWTKYTLEHTLHALAPAWIAAQHEETFLADASEAAKQHFAAYKVAAGPGRKAIAPLKAAIDPDTPEEEQTKALEQLLKVRGGVASRGAAVYDRVCASCHAVGNKGKVFGPDLSDIGKRFNKEQIVRSIIWPNEEISKGFETIMVVTDEGTMTSGFVLSEDEESITLGIADGKTVRVLRDEIELRKDIKASSMPEGLSATIAPIEFLDLVRYLQEQKAPPTQPSTPTGGAN